MDEQAVTDAIAFGTDGWRAPLSTFTTERVEMVGQAIATVLDEQNRDGPIAIGYDAREHSPGFAAALADVLASNGRGVVVAARDCPTPTLAWTVATGPFVGGFVVTASHNPPEYNGLKFVLGDGTPALPELTDEFERQLSAPVPSDPGDRVREQDLRGPYIEHVLGVLPDAFGIDLGLDGVTVAYDGMHGSGRDVTDVVLERTGASVTRLRCERDPTFGGTAPEPTPENASTLTQQVTDGGADIGFVNDGDADRVGVVTPARGFVDPNVVLAVVYDYLLEHADGDAVRTVSTSSLVDRIAAEHGQTVHETAVGFKWVAEAMGEHGALLGGEESGGYGVGVHLRNKDGVVLALILACAHSARPLDERIDDLFDTYGEIHQDRVSLDCPDEQKQPTLDALERELPGDVAGVAVDRVSTVDGFKLTLEDGTWILVRPSGTEPKLRIYAEATSETRVRELLDGGHEVVESALTETYSRRNNR